MAGRVPSEHGVPGNGVSGRGAAGRGGSERDRADPPISPPAFVGRTRECAALGQALAAGPAVVLLEGEAGVGKSRLLQEFLTSFRDGAARSLVARCPPFRVPYTLGPVVDALRSVTPRIAGLRLSRLAGALRPLFPEWTEELPPPPEPLEDVGAARYRLFRAVAELLERLDIDVVVLEDAHWADEATLAFLLFLVSGEPRCSAVVTYRPEDLPADSLLLRLSAHPPAGMGRLRLSLDALDVVHTGELVSSMLGGDPVPAGFAEFLYQRTGGIPLVIEESVRLLGERADLVRRDGGWFRRRLEGIAVPPSVRDAVLERSGRLDADARAVLQAAAVLAQPADVGLLAEVAGLSAQRAAAGLAEALRTRLVGEDERGRVSFRHALAARAVYEAMSGQERRSAHLRAGRELEEVRPRPLVALVRHFREAGETARWSRYAEAAAEQALSTADESAAASLLHELITGATLPADTLARLINRLPAGPITGTRRCHELIATLRSTLAEGTDGVDAQDGQDGAGSGVRGELQFHLGRLLNMVDEYTDSLAQTTAAIPYLAHNPFLAVRAMMVLAKPHGVDHSASEHRRWLRRAATLSATLPPGQRLVITLIRLDALLGLGEDEGWTLLAQLPELMPTEPSREAAVRINFNAGDYAVTWGHYGRARERLEAALARVDPQQYPRVTDMARTTMAVLDYRTGRWDGLIDRARAVRADRRDDPALVADGELRCVEGALLAATGDLAAAAARFAEAIELARRYAEPAFHPIPAGALADLYLAAGRVEDALAVTDEPMRTVAHKDIWLWATEIAPVRVRALLAAGREPDATEVVRRFTAWLRGRSTPAPRAALLLCRAIMAGHRGGSDGQLRAAQAFARAAQAWEALPRPYDALLARERQAHCLLAAGQRDAARTLLRDVHEGLSILGARVAADRTARDVHELGGNVPSGRRGRRSYGDQLSPRELEVVQLVTTGRTNREIAETLVLSPKTVGRHLDTAMRKLEVSSRTALAVKAIEAGIVTNGQQA